jgi:LPS-assembly protein
LVYNFTPDIDQEDLPDFDDTDRISRENFLNYGLTNSLIYRSRKKPVGNGKSDESATAEPYDYREFFRFKLDQSYYFNYNKLIDGVPGPFSSLNWRVDFAPWKYLKLESDGKWNPYDIEFVEHNLSAALSDVRGDRFFIERRFTKDFSDSIYLDGELKINDKISTYGFFEKNLLDDIRIQSGIGARYVAQCWSIDFSYVDDGTDRRYQFAISLHGLGRIRSGFAGRVVESPFAAPN